MKLIVQVVISTLCVSTAFAHSQTVDSCFAQYSGQLRVYNNYSSGQYKDCLVGSSLSYTPDVNDTLIDIRRLVSNLLKQLSYCAEKSTVIDFFKCYSRSLNQNLLILDNVNTQAQLGIATLNSNNSAVFVQDGCVGSVVLQSQTNAVQSLDILSYCLTKVIEKKIGENLENMIGGSSNNGSSAIFGGNSNSTNSSVWSGIDNQGKEHYQIQVQIY